MQRVVDDNGAAYESACGADELHGVYGEALGVHRQAYGVVDERRRNQQQGGCDGDEDVRDVAEVVVDAVDQLGVDGNLGDSGVGADGGDDAVDAV